MEKGMSFLGKLDEVFPGKKVDIHTYSPLTLAYIGDSIFDLCIRTLIVERGNQAPNNLHKEASRIVNAGSQAAISDALLPVLSEEELTIFRRGRNAKSYTSAKNASIADYRKATGLEALFGYLYLKDNMDRLFELLKVGLEKNESEENV